MFSNGISCDIYIGKGAGKKLLHDINWAKKSVKIVSPYLSPFLIEELIKMNERGIDVQLITTDEIEEYRGNENKNISKLLIQNKHRDEIAVEKVNSLKKKLKYLKIFAIVLFILITILISLTQNAFLALGYLGVLIFILSSYHLKKKIESYRIYTYTYSKLFDFKVFLSPKTTSASNTFIHSKIFLIDNRIAYLGSLNFTSSGTKYNYETRIRTQHS